MEFGLWSSRLNTHTYTHTLPWISFTVQLGVTPGHYEEVITTLVYILKFKIKTTFTSCSNNNLQTCFNLHTHKNKPWSTPNSIFIRFSPQVYRNTIICLKMQNGCRSDVSMQDTLQILHHNTNPNHTLGTSNTLSVPQILKPGLFRPIAHSQLPMNFNGKRVYVLLHLLSVSDV